MDLFCTVSPSQAELGCLAQAEDQKISVTTRENNSAHTLPSGHRHVTWPARTVSTILPTHLNVSLVLEYALCLFPLALLPWRDNRKSQIYEATAMSSHSIPVNPLSSTARILVGRLWLQTPTQTLAGILRYADDYPIALVV
jgi:hypothetical protein